MKKVVIFASSRKADRVQRLLDITRQTNWCKRYSDTHGFTVINTYLNFDECSQVISCPGFQFMLEDCSKHLFDAVLVSNLELFTYDFFERGCFQYLLHEKRIELIDTNESFQARLVRSTTAEILKESIETYQYECKIEMIRKGQDYNARQCCTNGGTVPLGYIVGENKKFEVDPKTAPIVLEVFQRYANGESLSAIAASLKSRGLKTRRNKPVSREGLASLLKNRKYLGEYRYRDIVIPGGVPALIPAELFHQVQARMEKQRNVPKQDYERTLPPDKPF
jgi:DNA invertase Pin-like site-specific DNA recombinase